MFQNLQSAAGFRDKFLKCILGKGQDIYDTSVQVNKLGKTQHG